MCGIVAYLGKKIAQPILVEGLKRLEYRGYDSAGIALLDNGVLNIKKSSGRIANLEEILPKPNPADTLGIAHTRWATHGEPNQINSHPHADYTGKIAVVHNGIIENYSAIKILLKNEGIEFKSETDTEVISNLIGYFYEKGDDEEEQKQSSGQNKFEWAVQRTLNELQGTYGLAIICVDFPDMLIGAKKGSPLIMGLGENEYIFASDASAIIEHTTQVIYLSDNAVCFPGTVTPLAVGREHSKKLIEDMRPKDAVRHNEYRCAWNRKI